MHQAISTATFVRKHGIPLISLMGLVAPLLVAVAPGYAQTPGADSASARLDASAYQRLVDENLELRREKQRLDNETGDLRRRNAALLVDLQDIERRKNQLALLMSQLKTPEENRAELERLQSEKRILLMEVDRLRKSLAEAAAPSTNTLPAVAPAPGSDLFRKVEKENADLRQELGRVREAFQKETATREALVKSEAALKTEVALKTEAARKAGAELEAARLREAALTKSLEKQARKAFEADRVTQEMKERQLEEERQREEAREAARQKAADARAALEAKPVVKGESVSDLLAAARAQLAAKRVREAEDTYLKALKKDPANPQVSYNLGVLYGDYLHDSRKATRYYRQYLKLAPRAPDAPAVRAWIMELDARLK